VNQIGRVGWLKMTDVSEGTPLSGYDVTAWVGLYPMSCQILKMGMEMASETPVIFKQLTQLIAREDFSITFNF
jgi:hypothetical protein